MCRQIFTLACGPTFQPVSQQKPFCRDKSRDLESLP